MISKEDQRRIALAWDAAQDSTNSPKVQAMVRSEVVRIRSAFARLPIAVSFVDHDPYGSFEEMRDQVQSTGRMLIYKGGSETPLWDPETNWMARAVHDWDHLQKACDFSLEGEAEAFRHAAQCRPGLAPLYLSEIMLQAAVRNYTGRFASQKLVVLPPELERWASSLRGVQGSREPSDMAQDVWTLAAVLQLHGIEAATVHAQAMGYDRETTFVLLDAASRVANAGRSGVVNDLSMWTIDRRPAGGWTIRHQPSGLPLVTLRLKGDAERLRALLPPMGSSSDEPTRSKIAQLFVELEVRPDPARPAYCVVGRWP